jgi:hypothetical protein
MPSKGLVNLHGTLVKTQIKQFMTNLSNFHFLEKTRFWQNFRSKQIFPYMPKGTNVRNLRQVRIKLTTLASQLL